MRERVSLIDELRGFAVIIMIVFHFIYQENLWTGSMGNLLENFYINLLKVVAQIIFITIAGICCNYSRDNVKRGLLYLYIGLFINLVTFIVAPENRITFGIFSFMGVSIIIYEVSKHKLNKFKTKKGIFIFVALFITFNIIEHKIPSANNEIIKEVIQGGYLNFMGIKSRNFISSDFFPVLPWIFIFLAGALWGSEFNNEVYIRRREISLLAFVGRRSLFIYLVHIPILLLIINFKNLIFN